MLDVGHGLAVVISQGDEAVVYDTGNRWQQSNAGERIIVPWLLRHGLKLQQVIISHRHLDHYGGLSGILSYWPATPSEQHCPAADIFAVFAEIAGSGSD